MAVHKCAAIFMLTHGVVDIADVTGNKVTDDKFLPVTILGKKAAGSLS